jgi:hypothetical protein
VEEEERRNLFVRAQTKNLEANKHICITSPLEARRSEMVSYYFRCIKWLWKNKKWENTRQKFKAMDNEVKR